MDIDLYSTTAPLLYPTTAACLEQEVRRSGEILFLEKQNPQKLLVLDPPTVQKTAGHH
jgi:hypothetical protein